MSEPTIRDVKVFTPAKDFALSRRFYLALGGTINWEDEWLIEFEFAATRILLQNAYVKQWADNFVLFMIVDDADAWYARMQEILADGAFSPARVAEPRDEPWGARVTYVWDPSGVLIQLAEFAVDGD